SVGLNAGSVLTAGQSTVSPTEYRLAYERELIDLSENAGTRLTREQARLFGIENRVLSQLVSGVVLDEQAREMQLGMSEDRIAGLIAEEPAFHGVNGRFSRDQFRFVLQQVGMSEDDYIQSLQGAAVRQQVVEAAADGMQMPQFFRQTLRLHRGQSRDAVLVEIPRSSITEPDDPTDEALSAYFEENLARYRAPEYRGLKYVELNASAISDPDGIDLQTVRDEYEANLARYTEAERRTVLQLVFGSTEDAEAARDRLLAGETFETIVTETGRTMGDVTLGTFTQAQMTDPGLAEVAFGLEAVNTVSDVTEGLFGPVLVWVSDIQPEAVSPFEEVESQIREDLAIVEANDTLLSVSDAYEDARAGGASMEEAAGAQQLEIITIEAIDARGRDKQEQAVDLPEPQELLNEVFTADTDVENPPIASGRDGFIWYEVTSIEDARDRTLDEVRERVVEDWRGAQLNDAMQAQAEAIAEALASQPDANVVAEENGFSALQKLGLTRNADDPDLGRSGVQALFDPGPNATGVVEGGDGERLFAYRITAITNPVVDTETETEIDALVSQGFGNDILQQLVGKLQNEYPVTVNNQAIQFALGQGSGL
ncbi:MAG: peptidyl-prolyl cis-trans isomerase, partial [Pseudomonadota bacterium]